MSEGCGNAPSDSQWGFSRYLTDEEKMLLGEVDQQESLIERLFAPQNDSEWAFARIYTRLCHKAIEKNRSYGDSMLHPLGIYGDADPLKAIGARIDDKLSRHKNHQGAFGENDTEDLIGYLVGWLIAEDTDA